MIASAVSLSATTLPVSGPARPTGAVAFVLPGEMPVDVIGNAAVGDGATLPIDGDRQDDAAPGNPLPDAPLDPWLLTLVAPAPVDVPASGIAAASAQPVGDQTADRMRTQSVAPALPSSPVITLPNAASAEAGITDATVRPPGDHDCAPSAPVATPIAGAPTLPREGRSTLSISSPIATDPTSTVDRPTRASNDTAPLVQTLGSPKTSRIPAPVVMPTVALGTSALTPLRREIAAVAALVDDAAVAPAMTGVPIAAQDAGILSSRSDILAPAAVASVAAPQTVDAGASLDAASEPDRPTARRAIDRAVTPRATPDVDRSPPPTTPAVVRPLATPPPPASLPIGWTLTAPAPAPTAVPAAASTTLPAPVASTVTSVAPPVAAAIVAPAIVASTSAPTEAAATVAHDPSPAPASGSDEARAGARTAIAPPLVTDIAPAAPPTTAAIAFGVARFAAQRDDARTDPRAPALGDAVAGVAPTVSPVAAPAVSAPIDVRHERWPTAMIERIEIIREAVAEAADAADTRIRLVPDALGSIDVDVRRDGDTLHVRFTAEQPQTRALLHDAQPRLAEAAEQRGLRLGQTSVGGDAAGLGQQSPGQQSQAQQQPSQQRQSLAAVPTRAPRSTVAAADADADDPRLA